MSFNPDLNVLKQNLEHWFKYDNLSFEQGIAMLVGVEPVDETIKALNNSSSDDARESIKSGVPLLNGDKIGGEENKTFIERHSDREYSHGYTYERAIITHETSRFQSLVEQYNQLLQYWNSGEHPAITSPSYFVEWALAKDIPPEWLNDAIEFGIFKPAKKNTCPSDSIDKPLLPLERRTLLTIIAALCDKSKIQYDKRGAAAEIARLTEASKVRVSEDTISRVLKEIPSALKERDK